jgi:hypothetical protein
MLARPRARGVQRFWANRVLREPARRGLRIRGTCPDSGREDARAETAALTLAVGAVAVVLAATALVAAAWQGYAKLPPGHAAPG